MDKAGLLALVAQQNLDLVAAVNALADESVNPLQALFDAANQKISDLEAKIAKAASDVAVVSQDLLPVA